MSRTKRSSKVAGFSIPELVVGIMVLSILVIGVMGTYTILLGSAGLAKMKSAGLGVATAELEQIRSLPYDHLATEGGAIESSGPKLPPTKDSVIGKYNFTVTTTINYIDDAYDGCLDYPNGQEYLCSNGPAKTDLPIDDNPKDYKMVDIKVQDKNNDKIAAHLSTHISAKVAETAGNTGALVVTVVDSYGQPVPGATVLVKNDSLDPVVSQSLTTNNQGIAVFLDLRPDNHRNYVVTASKSGYTSLSTIPYSGVRTPNYPNVNIVAQQVSSSTMKIDQISEQSLKIITLDSSGNLKPGTEFSITGGVKRYSNDNDNSYYYSQTGLVTDANSEYMFSNLSPGPYTICYENNKCSGSTYLHLVQSTYGDTSFQPLVVNPGSVSPSGSGPMQVAKLFISDRPEDIVVDNISPAVFESSDSYIAQARFTITGDHLSGANVTLKQDSITLPTTVVNSDNSNSISRQVDLSGKNGAWVVVIEKNGLSLNQTGLEPGGLGGINVVQ